MVVVTTWSAPAINIFVGETLYFISTGWWVWFSLVYSMVGVSVISKMRRLFY